MKNYHIKDLLKKELLIVELPKSWGLTIGDEYLLIYDHEEKTFGKTYTFKGSYTLLGKPDEISENIAKELVNLHESGYYKDYINGNNFFTLPSKSLLSALESEIYWNVNPWGNRMPIFVEASPSAFKFVEKEKERWKQAQEKTFDKKRVKIFVKN